MIQRFSSWLASLSAMLSEGRSRSAAFVVRRPITIISLWLGLTAWSVLTLSAPHDAAVASSPAPLPSGAPSMVAGRAMNDAFDRSTSPNIVLLILTDPDGLKPGDEATYRQVVSRLATSAHDALTSPDGAAPGSQDRMISADNKSWILPLNLAGQVGSPTASIAYQRVVSSVQDAVARTPLTASFLGAEATTQNSTVGVTPDMRMLEIAAAIITLTVLLIVYRSPVIAVLSLCPTVISILLARNVLAGLAHVGLPGSGHAVALATAVMLAAGLAQAILLVGRYHEFIRSGRSSDDAIGLAVTIANRAVGVPAATAAIALTGMSLARLGALSRIGPTLGIAVAIGALSTLTLLPAMLVIAARRDWVPPPRPGSGRGWRVVAVNVVRRPALHLGIATLAVVALATCIGFIRVNYADLQAVPALASSDRHSGAADYIVVHSGRDLRSPQALADLELMAQRVSQVPGVAAVFGLTRPSGQPLQQAKVSFQAAEVGTQLSGAAADITNAQGRLDSLSRGSQLLADTIAKAAGTINQVLGTVEVLLTALADLEHQLGGEKALTEIASTGPIFNTLRSVGQALGMRPDGQQTLGDVLIPVVDGLTASPTCDANPSCGFTRAQLRGLIQGHDAGSADGLNDLGRALTQIPINTDITTITTDLQRIVDALLQAMRSLGAQGVAPLQQQLGTLGVGANGLAQGSQQLATQINTLVDQTKQMGAGLRQSAEILSTLGRIASPASMAGFNLPPEVLNTPAMKNVAAMMVSEDGHTVRYLVQSSITPSSRAAADYADAVLVAARSAQPNTTLAAATVSLSGSSAIDRDLRNYYGDDLEWLGAVMVIVMLATLTFSLRAVVAPVYVVASTALAYLAALGITGALMHCALHQQVSAGAPIAASIALAAISPGRHLTVLRRIRDVSPKILRFSIIQESGSVGGVAAWAGIAAAAAMSTLMFSGVGTLAQVGFIVGVGLVIDTLVVHAVMVPALATLFGPAGWWPARVVAGLRHRRAIRTLAVSAVRSAKAGPVPGVKPTFIRLSRRSFV